MVLEQIKVAYEGKNTPRANEKRTYVVACEEAITSQSGQIQIDEQRIELVYQQEEGWRIAQDEGLWCKIRMIRNMAKVAPQLVVNVIAYDGPVSRQEYYEIARQAQHEIDRANTERDSEATYVTITVDEIVQGGMMHASECQPYNSIQVALSLYTI